MQAYAIYYRFAGTSWINNEYAEAKNKDYAIRKAKRKIAKYWRISEDEIIITDVRVIGYF